MTKTVINPATLTKPSGYAHGILAWGGRVLFLAGQTGVDATGKIVAPPPDIVAQFRQALANLRTVVEAAGAQMTDVVKMTIFVTSKTHYQANAKTIGEVYRSFFGKHYPAMTLVEVKGLWDAEAMVEIEAIAVLGH